MKIYDDLTPALQAILLHYSRGYTCWFSITCEQEKLEGLAEKWAEAYGTRLPSYIRQDRKGKGLPTAVAVAAPMIGSGRKEVIVMATEFAKTIKLGPFSRERWTTTFPKFSQFHLIREVRERGDYAMTWRLNSDRAGQLEAYLIALVKSGDGKAVAGETYQWARFYPMYGGVRRQLRRILTAARKLWTATRKEQDWPGQDPEKLPILAGFYREQK